MRQEFIALGLLLAPATAAAVQVPVTTVQQLQQAVARARAGDEIILGQGTYTLPGLHCDAVGTAAAPIIVRAEVPLMARVRFDDSAGLTEGFLVSGAYWHFQDLDVAGVCKSDADCEHAFHVIGQAVGFALQRCRIFDFNAQLKVNSAPLMVNGKTAWFAPHAGLVEGNEVGDGHRRNTTSPVTKLNIDTGDDWIVRANYLHDFHKTDATPTYGAFMKSGGQRGLFERNLVLCTRDVPAPDAVTLGLSFGGGGTAPQYCAPAYDPGVPCSVEHSGGVMRNNIIANCSDVGIYLNQARDMHLLHNTLIATSGIDFRFASTSGEARGNLGDAAIHARDGGTFAAMGNLLTLKAADFAAMYRDPLAGDLRRKGDLSALLGRAAHLSAVTDDYCLRPRGAGAYDIGALQASSGDCDTVPPPLPSAAGGGPDGGSPSGGSAGGGGCRMADRAEGGGLYGMALCVLLGLLVCHPRSLTEGWPSSR